MTDKEIEDIAMKVIELIVSSEKMNKLLKVGISTEDIEDFETEVKDIAAHVAVDIIENASIDVSISA